MVNDSTIVAKVTLSPGSEVKPQGILKDISLVSEATEVYLLSKPKYPLLPINSLPKLNHKIWGLNKGRVIIVAGRTAMGKTALMTQMAWDLGMNKNRTIYLTLEMPEKELYARCFCRTMRVNNYEIEQGRFDEHIEKYKDFRKSHQNMTLKFSETIGKSWKQIDEILQKMEGSKPSCIIIDHINHIKSSGVNDKAVIDDYLTNIQEAANKYDITFIIGAQINRLSQSEKNPRPELHHLKGTGRLEEISDMVILLFWPYYYDKTKNIEDYEIIVAKNRYGATGVHDCSFYPQHSLFTEKNNVQKLNKFRDITKSTIKEDEIDWGNK